MSITENIADYPNAESQQRGRGTLTTLRNARDVSRSSTYSDAHERCAHIANLSGLQRTTLLQPAHFSPNPQQWAGLPRRAEKPFGIKPERILIDI
ncbi:MAG: hypothetical protein HY243_13395 [Proteobacteria bacterium]|nr:hypothetical protein [Pseudomonadota bacterium]